MVTSTEIVNQALQLIGNNQAPVTGVAPNFDTSTAGQAAAKLYAPTVAAVARQFGWDFARTKTSLSLTGNTAPAPWAYEYAYPTGCVEVWQLMPATITDPNNPLPVNWSVGNALVSSVRSRVIWTDLASATAVFNSNPPEGTWDSLFREAVVRTLASGLAMATAGRPDTAQGLLESAQAFGSMAASRDS